jgi:hypothetical protein
MPVAASAPIQHNAKQNKCRYFYVPSRIWTRDPCVKAISTEGVLYRVTIVIGYENLWKRELNSFLRSPQNIDPRFRDRDVLHRGKSVLMDKILRMPRSQSVHSDCKEKNSYPATNRITIFLIQLPPIDWLPWLKTFLSFPVVIFINTLQYFIPQYVFYILVDNPQTVKAEQAAVEITKYLGQAEGVFEDNDIQTRPPNGHFVSRHYVSCW